MKGVGFAGIVIAALLAAPPKVPAGMVRHGEGRATIDYAETEPSAKRVLLSRINHERRSAGLSTLEPDLLAAKVGDDFCLDLVQTRAMGHWDTQGRAPYLRWALAGGVDYHGQNVSSRSWSGFKSKRSTEELLLDAHAAMMAEKPPDDGHRKTVLDPIWTHVGIGCARIEGEFRMTEEYSRHVAEYVEIPAAPQKLGAPFKVSFRLGKGWNVGPIEVAHEPFPAPLTPAEIAKRGSYRYPPVIRQLMPSLPTGVRWIGGERGDFQVGAGGRVDLSITMNHGPGNYFFLIYAGKGELSGQRLSPATVALVAVR